MTKLKTSIILAVVLAFGILFTSCNEDIKPEGNWTLISVEDKENSFSIADGSLTETVSLFLSLTKDGSYAISGFAGVNTYAGSATFEKNEITVNPLALTMMMGTDEAQKIENSFLAAVQAGGKIKVKNDGDETILVLENSKAKTSLEFKKTILENTSWDLVLYNIENAVTNLPEAVSNVTIGFAADNSIYGNTGTNQIIGDFEYTKDGSLTFGPMGMTRMAAINEDAFKFEVRLMELYSQVKKYSINGAQLTLSNDAGETLLVFAK